MSTAAKHRSSPQGDGTARVALLTSFFQRLERLEGIVRIILKDAPLSARLEFRGEPSGEVRLDYSSRPARIQVGRGQPPGRIQVSIDSGVLHQVLLGNMAPGEALGRRELLLRGSAADLARFIPLLDFAPLLYREHLADLGHEGFCRPGCSVAGDLSQESTMETKGFRGDPIPLRSLTGPERAIFRVIQDAAYGVGYGVGLLRHRFLRNLSLFEVLEALSRGVEAAASASRGASQGEARRG